MVLLPPHPAPQYIPASHFHMPGLMMTISEAGINKTHVLRVFYSDSRPSIHSPSQPLLWSFGAPTWRQALGRCWWRRAEDEQDDGVPGAGIVLLLTSL